MKQLNIFNNKNDKFIIVDIPCEENIKDGLLNVNYSAKNNKEKNLLASDQTIAIFKVKIKKHKLC